MQEPVGGLGLVAPPGERAQALAHDGFDDFVALIGAAAEGESDTADARVVGAQDCIDSAALELARQRQGVVNGGVGLDAARGDSVRETFGKGKKLILIQPWRRLAAAKRRLKSAVVICMNASA